MKQLSFIFFLLFFLFSLQSCKQQPTQVSFNDYVEEYTTGIVSRKNSVEIMLSEPLSTEQQNPELLRKAFSITPKATGKLEVLNDKRIVFQPDPGFDAGIRYTVTLNLSEFFKTSEKDKKFTFSFETIAPDLAFRLNELDIDVNEKHDTIYEVKGSILLSDWADSTTIHNLIGFDTPVIIDWDKVECSKIFDFTLTTRSPFQVEKQIEIFSKKNNVGYPKKVLGKIRIPGKNDFDVYSIEPINSGEEYIEVSFTRSLDPQQDLNGLVQVEPGRDVSFSIEENKLRIWFQNKTIPEREIIIHSGIRSLYNARTLQTDQTQANRYRKRIAFHTNYPNLEFAGEGGILPESDKMVVPFFATNLRGVIVRVIRVYENNMGEFLQSNQLNEGNELAAMGDLLCRKIIFLDEKGNVDIHTRNAFAIDLKDLITPEPGGLYRIILSYNYELSAYPCAGVTRKTKRELLEENKILEQEEKDNFGNGNAYYYFSDQSWNGYRWEERNMPCSTSYYLNKQIAKNIICSNLGIIVKKGDRGKLFISVNNILTGEPEPDVSVGVFSYQNQEIARQTTWEDGTTEVELNNKKPFYLIAQKEKQKGYLRLAEGESLSMSAFDVSGEEVKNGTKGFIYTDRGVWRPGDTIYVSFILNNAYNDLPVNHPVTFELFNPSGQLYWKKSLSTRSDNFYVFKPATTQNAPTGIWNGRISVGGVTFHKKLRIETIKPNRLSIDLSFDEDIIQRDTETTATLKAQWLTGATANELKYDIYATLVPTKTTFKDWENYVFDDPGRKFQADDILFSKGTTNENGEVKIETKMMQGGFAPGMLRAQFITKVYEESGEFSVNSTQKQYSPFKTYVGILSPQEDKDPLLTNKRHIFEYVTLFPNGKTAPDRLVNINLYKVEWYWWWSSDRSQIADYVSSSYNKPVRKFSAKSNQIGKGKFQFKIPDVEWGTYYIQITDVESGHQSGILAYFDSYGENARSREGSDKAMLLTLKTDKDCYQPGDDIVVSFPSTSDSHAILTVEASGGILEHHEIKCNGTETKFSIKAIREMQPNAYISVTLLNPYHSKNNDLPIRLYGVIPVKVNAANSKLEPVIEAPESMRPNSTCKITISEKKGIPMTFTLGVVDEGLLDLTNFKTPSPWDAFFAKEALGMRTWDVYNYVLGAYGGKIEQIFSIGGDDALNKGPKAIVNRFKPVVRFVGPYTLNANEKRSISIDIPEYIGKVRCMVVAGNKHQFGNAQKDIFVKQPVMVLGTLPRQLAPGDEIWVPATVFAMDNQVGRVKVNMEVNSAFSIIGPSSQEINFEKEGNQVVWFQIKAKEQLEPGMVRLTAFGKGEKATWNSDIAIKSPLERLIKKEDFMIKPGEKKNFSLTPFGISGSNKAEIVVSGIKPMNLNHRVNYVLHYPYECLEQLVSKAYIALLLPDMGSFSPKELEGLDNVVRSCLSKLRNYMIPGGGFAYWPGGTSSNGWSSIYAYMFLTEAAERGFVVTPGLRNECGQYQARLAREWKPVASPALALETDIQAFRLYALAANNIPEKGAMNRFKAYTDKSAEAEYFLATAFSYDKPEIAKKLVEAAGQAVNIDNGEIIATNSLYINAIRLIAFLSVNNQKQAHNAAEALIKRLNTSQIYNTAGTATAFTALTRYYKKFPPSKNMNFDIKMNEKVNAISSEKTLWMSEIELNKKTETVEITNNSKGTLFVESTCSGIPKQGNQFATANGIDMEIRYTTMNGRPIDIRSLEQGTNFMMEISVTNTSGILLNSLMVHQMVPAGWEIINRNFLLGTERYPAGITYQTYGDDYIASFIPAFPVGKQITIPVQITASYAGIYYMPISSCKGMYNLSYYATSEGMEVEVRRD